MSNKSSLRQVIDALNEIEKHEKRRKDSLSWVTASLRALYELCDECGQMDYPRSKDGICYVTRVVRVNRFVDEKTLKQNRIRYVFCSGLFVAVDGAIVDRVWMGKYFNPKIETGEPFLPMEIEQLGLPSTLRYETVKRLENRKGFILADNEFNSLIRYPSHYDYLELGLEDFD